MSGIYRAGWFKLIFTCISMMLEHFLVAIRSSRIPLCLSGRIVFLGHAIRPIVVLLVKSPLLLCFLVSISASCIMMEH